MKLESATLYLVESELKFRFETSFDVETKLRKVILVLKCEGAEGYGEGTANNWPGYSYETADTIWLVLKDYILPRVLGKDYATPQQLLYDLRMIRGHSMAVATLETAFWDALAKSLGVPLWVLLGGTRLEHPVGASLGIQKSVEETVEIAQRHLAEGYKRLKFKIKPGWDVAPLRAVREALPDAALTVDANSAYQLTDARVMQALDELNLDYIEQPLAYDDLVDHAKLQGMLGTPICLDESVHSAADARKGLQLDAGRVINLKLGRVGGYSESKAVHDVAASFGAPVWCGGMLELGVGRAHNLQLSTLPNFKLPGDTASASRYWHQDITTEWLDAVDGVQKVPGGPGIGVGLNQETLDVITTHQETVTA